MNAHCKISGEQLPLFDIPSQPKPKKQGVLDRLVDDCIVQMDGWDEGMKRQFLLHLQLRQTLEFLSQFTPNERRQFAAQLLESVMHD